MPFKRVLFVAVLTQNLRQILDTVTCMPGIEHELFALNEAAETGPCDLRLHAAFRRFEPDLIVLVPTLVEFDRMPTRGYLDALRRDCAIPIVQLYTDLPKPVWQDIAAKLIVAADAVVSLVGAGAASLNAEANPDIPRLDLWTPVIPPAPYDGAREIDVSMLGSLRDFPYRGAALEHLRARGISVLTGGGQEADYGVGADDYYRVLQRSKIVLNFSQLGANIQGSNGDLVHGLKGRVLEALACGALLLESRNPVTARYFAEGDDYIAFDGLDDLAAKIDFYLARDAERRVIAEHGRNTFEANYTAARFWGRVLDAAAVARARTSANAPPNR